MVISLDLVDGYSLSNDTIYFYDSVSEDYNNFYIVKSITKDKIVLLYRSGKVITLLRILESINEKKYSKNIDEYQIVKEAFVKKFWERKEKYGCKYSYESQGEVGDLVIEDDDWGSSETEELNQIETSG